MILNLEFLAWFHSHPILVWSSLPNLYHMASKHIPVWKQLLQVSRTSLQPCPMAFAQPSVTPTSAAHDQAGQPPLGLTLSPDSHDVAQAHLTYLTSSSPCLPGGVILGFSPDSGSFLSSPVYHRVRIPQSTATFPPSHHLWNIFTWMRFITSNSPCPKVRSLANLPVFL